MPFEVALATIKRVRPLFDGGLRSAVDRLDPSMSLIAAYQMGWCDADGQPSVGGGGKSIRPTLAVLSAEAVGAPAGVGVPAAVAVELVHNFSLLHDDVMDGDIERRHRPTGWTVFGRSQAILAGSAMLTAAFGVLAEDGVAGQRALLCLIEATQALIAGQSADLRLEEAESPRIEDCLQMEAGKTAALLSCSTAIGASAAGADAQTVHELAAFGHELGMAFQLVDDVLGIVGDPKVTGKSSMDVRSGKRSAPVVAALNAGLPVSAQLAVKLAQGAPKGEDDVELITSMISDAGGVTWTSAEADRRLEFALGHLGRAGLSDGPRGEFEALAQYVVGRDS
ncbi:polyprenyl synthetase family protein [Jatrophihabitans sp. DSM 45814]